ncbi:hypothetical protein GC207_11145 [bacterium]|nr:hypothetical protein [bacterium]
MNLRPVIERELVSEARNEVNYWLRLIGAAALLFVGAMYVVNDANSSRWQGALLFEQMNLAIWATAFVLVPVLTADSVAREKREGTLGLLFLTPLTSPDIVIGKCLVHGLRSLTILVATIPVLCVPLMMGGISFWQIVSAVATNLGALCLGMAAGIHASVRQVDWLSAVAHALLTGIGMFVGFWVVARALNFFPSVGGFIILPVAAFVLQRFLRTNAIWLARNWRRELYRAPEPYWVNQIARSPVWRRVMAWPRTTALERNPIAWLEEHRWSARITKWAWLGIVLGATVLGGCIVGPFMDYTTWLNILTLLLAGGLSFLAANSFRREQESGALELLLVTPLSTRQIVQGRLRGMILHFLPATMLLAFFWIIPAWFSNEITHATWMSCWFGFSTLVTIPLIGFWFALRRLHYVTAWLLTVFVGYLVPAAAAFALRIVLGTDGTIPVVVGLSLFTGYQLVVAAICFRQVQKALEARSFMVG